MTQPLETLTTGQQASIRGYLGINSAAAGTFAVSTYYSASDGANLRPAYQAAINAAAAANGKVFNDYGPVAQQLWDKPATAPSGVAADKLLIVPACASVDIDFNGATITLKNPGGTARIGQAVVDAGQGAISYGGFLYIGGAITGTFRLANVTVAGGAVRTSPVSLYDKGFNAQDLAVSRIVMENVTLRGFYGEVMYDNSARLHISRDCTFSDSPQSAWNPSGTGRVVAYNLTAGDAQQSAETIGGLGHTYYGGRFYNSFSNTFIGGPDSSFSGAAYNSAVRRTDAPPPYTQFIGTRFEDCGDVYLGCWSRGSIECVDTRIIFQNGFSVDFNLHDIDLDIVSVIDRGSHAFPAVTINGPATLNGSEMTNTTLKVRTSRTNYAAGAGASSFNAAFVISGAVGTGCLFIAEGRADQAWKGASLPVGIRVPRIIDDGFFPNSADFIYFTTNFTHTISSGRLLLYADSAGVGTFNASVDTTRIYSDGQRFRFIFGSNGPLKIVSFAATGAGMLLPATRELKNIGDYLDLEYCQDKALWVERKFTAS